MKHTPPTATHYLPTPNGTPQLWYRTGTVKMNTGEILPTLEFLGFAGTWQGSFDPDRERLMSRLVAITHAETAQA